MLGFGLGRTGCRRRTSKPESGPDLPEPAADSPAAACSADDAVSGAGSDTTPAAVAASQSSAVGGRESGDPLPPGVEATGDDERRGT